MRAAVAGIGCVTPLGCGMDEVWRRVDAGESPELTRVVNPETAREHVVAPVPKAVLAGLAHLGREPRMRRASPISLFAAAAGKAALADSGLELAGPVKSRLAVVFGVSSGGVQYTRRFYEQVVKQGANAASPLLFPETVYNAPASHLAAMLGVDGATYTLVGDGTVGMQALHFAAQLLAINDADHVLVVAAEELDWILAEAHHDWRLLATARTVPRSPAGRRGAIIAEGAAAVLLQREGGRATIEIAPGESFFSRKDAAGALSAALSVHSHRGPVDLIADGANGTWVDDPIREAVARNFPQPPKRTLPVKEWFGEAIGCGALLQVVAGVDGLARFGCASALVPCIGWNQQAAAAWIGRCG